MAKEREKYLDWKRENGRRNLRSFFLGGENKNELILY